MQEKSHETAKKNFVALKSYHGFCDSPLPPPPKKKGLKMGLHCYNIEKFDEIYGEYIENIMKYFTVIVTYCEGNKFPKLNFIFSLIKILPLIYTRK